MIIDFHIHLTTAKGMERQFEENGKDPLSKSHFSTYMKLATEREGNTSRENWVQAMKTYGVSRIVLNACDALNEELLDLVQQDPEHFSGFVYCDATQEDSILQLERFIGPGKLVGVGEISPTWEHYRVSDERLFPFYEKTQELQIPILWHFGIGFFPFGDLRYSEPYDLVSIVQNFPKITHVISHLGVEQAEQFLGLASWMKEWWKVPIYFDLAGPIIQDIPKYYLGNYSVKDLISRFLQVLGPEHILWATDSGEPYKSDPFETETFKALEGLRLGATEMDLILGENAARVLSLPA